MPLPLPLPLSLLPCAGGAASDHTLFCVAADLLVPPERPNDPTAFPAGPNTPIFVVYILYVLYSTQPSLRPQPLVDSRNINTSNPRPIKIKLPECMSLFRLVTPGLIAVYGCGCADV